MFLYKFIKKIKKIFLLLFFLSIGFNSYSNEVDHNNIEKIIQKINDKNSFIKTAHIKGKVSYILPKNKKIKLYKKYKIKKDSKILINIYILLRFKVAKFISDGQKIQYKRIKKKVKVRDISDFNLSIFNKHLDFDLTVKELNNLLLGLNLSNFNKSLYKYKIDGKYLYVTQNSIINKIDLDSNQIVEITINDSRKATIIYEDFKPVKIHKNAHRKIKNIVVPRKISFITPKFSMKINHQNAIIINKQINKNRLLIN